MDPTTQQTTEPRAIQLLWDGPNVVVMPEDHDRFVIESQRAVTASQNGLAAEGPWQKFTDEFLAPIHQWCQEHQDRVVGCYVPFPKDHLQVFVVRRSDRYDFTLGDGLADLEMNLFEKQWPSDINQISHGHLETFFDPAASIQVYGNGG